MQLDDPLILVPAIEEAIDRQPLIVALDTPVINVIALMNQSLVPDSSLPAEVSASDPLPPNGKRSTYAVVMEGTKILGIITERDIVRLTAAATKLEGVSVASVMTQSVITLSMAAFQDISAALFLFRRYRIRHLPIVSDRKELIGVVSPESIRRVLRPANLLKRRRVSELMTTSVIQAPPTASVLSLAQKMATHRISCVVITLEDEEGFFQPVGIVTERDIVQLQSLQIDFARTQAQTVMSTPLFLLNPEDTLDKAYQEMQRRRVRRLVVSWDWGRGLGILTETDLLRVFDPMEMYGIIQILRRTIEQLKQENATNLSTQTHQTEPLLSADDTPNMPKANATAELNTLLSTIQSSVESLANQPDMSPDLRQIQINLVLGNIERIRKLMEGLN